MLSSSCCGFVPVELLYPTGWLTSVRALLEASEEKDASSCFEGAPHPPTAVHFRDVIALSSCAPRPTGSRDLQIQSPYGRGLKGRIWQTGVFFLACHFTLPMQTALYSCCTDPTHSAYGTWGIICRSLTQQGYFSYADFCLHALLFLMLFCFFFFFLSLGFGLWCGVLHSYEYRRRMVAQWRDGMALRRKEKGRKRGETERCRVEGRSSPAGGSPQATSDIPLSDGLMRLPWHFFLPT